MMSLPPFVDYLMLGLLLVITVMAYAIYRLVRKFWQHSDKRAVENYVMIRKQYEDIDNAWKVAYTNKKMCAGFRED